MSARLGAARGQARLVGSIGDCFDYIEAWYSLRRRHSTLDMLGTVQYELAHAPISQQRDTLQQSAKPGQAQVAL